MKMNKLSDNWIILMLLLGLFTLIKSAKFGRLLQYDPYCNRFDIQTGKCSACICRYYFDSNGFCTPVHDLCKTWNINDGKCTTCYKGYQLKRGICSVIPNNLPIYEDSFVQNYNCKTQDSYSRCLTCRDYYVLHCGDCMKTGQNPHCAVFGLNRECFQCKDGYQMDNNKICQQKKCSQFPGCKQCNQNQCTQCQIGYYQQYYSRKCVIPKTNCKQGCQLCSQSQCFSCSEGYSAQGWPICQYCSFMYAKNSLGKCKPIQKDCSPYGKCTFCVKDQCLMCQQGYQLDQNLKCVYSYA